MLGEADDGDDNYHSVQLLYLSACQERVAYNRRALNSIIYLFTCWAQQPLANYRVSKNVNNNNNNNNNNTL
jgi:hypothetical protein